MRKVAHWCIAYIAVALSAGLAAWSGVRAADASLFDAIIKGIIMFMIAVLGCHGWAWAGRLAKDGHRGWAVTSWAILTVALGVTLLGGAGSFYSAATKRNAVAAQATDAYDRADAELRRIEDRRKKLTAHRSAGEIEPDITQAMADPRFKSSKECAPEHITKSLEFCSIYRALERELAAAKVEEALDKQAAPYLAVVGKGRPSSASGPGTILAAIFGLSDKMGDALFSLMCTIALDFGAVIALLTAALASAIRWAMPCSR